MGLIRTGKGSYNAIEDFSARTDTELADTGSVLFKRDTQPPQHEVDFVEEQLAGAVNVLELGCGLGPWAALARSMGLFYTGVDPVAKRVAFCKREHAGCSELTFVEGDARLIRLWDPQEVVGDAEGLLRGFDVVLSVTVLQHLLLEDACAFLRTAEYHLAPHGKIVLIESKLYDLSEADCDRLYAEESCADHMVPKSLDTLKAAVPMLQWEQVGGDRYILTRR